MTIKIFTVYIYILSLLIAGYSPAAASEPVDNSRETQAQASARSAESSYSPLPEIRSYELNYGPGTKITLIKSQKLIGLKFASVRADTRYNLHSILGDEADKFTSIHADLGKFQILELKTLEDLNAKLDKIRSFQGVKKGTHVYHTHPQDLTPVVPTGELYVKFKKNVPPDECVTTLKNHALYMLEARGKNKFIVSLSPSALNPIKTAQLLQTLESVEIAEPDLARPLALLAFDMPQDEYLGMQWHLYNDGTLVHNSVWDPYRYIRNADARVIDAWEALDSFGMDSFGSPDIFVAVIDTGFDVGPPAPSRMDRFFPHASPFSFFPFPRSYHNLPRMVDGHPDITSWTEIPSYDNPFPHPWWIPGPWNLPDPAPRVRLYPSFLTTTGFRTLEDVVRLPMVGIFVGMWRQNLKIVYPWDFTRGNQDPRPYFDDPRLRQKKTDKDYSEGVVVLTHGTAVAGTAVGNVGGGKIVGVAPNARLMPVRASINTGEFILSDEMAQWFTYVMAHGADVVNCSWGGNSGILSSLQIDAIRKCAQDGRRDKKGCVIVVGAGNDNRDINDEKGGYINGLAILPEVIAVAASTGNDERLTVFGKPTLGSNFGQEISICAPGEDIFTCSVLRYGDFYGDWNYLTRAGTSLSAAIVSGVAALVLSVNPNLTSAEVKRILETTARPIGAPASYDKRRFIPEENRWQWHSKYYGYGCVNAEGAVKAAYVRLLGQSH